MRSRCGPDWWPSPRQVHHLPGDGRRRHDAAADSCPPGGPVDHEKVPLVGADGYFALVNQTDQLWGTH
jgi:hypothetical protein